MLATTRARRQNAGQRMTTLINDEEDNEFYKNAYGGFNEEQEDVEFHVNEDEVEEDYVDSDFDFEENENNNEEGNEENEDLSEKKAAKRKAYDPPKTPNTQNMVKPREKIKKMKTFTSVESDSTENKTLRNSTAMKRKELEIRQKERAERKMTKNVSIKRNFNENYRLTQDELLEEAIETEKINLASLDAYHKLELAKKKTKFVKAVIKGPSIRYHSTIMPFYNEKSEIDESKKHIRNFIIFSDEATLNENFKKSEHKLSHPKFCVITGLPAKYFDPATQSPYANAYAYKILKDLHKQKQIVKASS